MNFYYKLIKKIKHEMLKKMKEIMKTDFQNVKVFSETFGVPVFEEPQYDIFEKNPKLVELRMSLILEEFKELEQAVKNHDMVETVDALAELIYVVQGMGSSLGVDLDKAFDIVHKSNMSKVCETVKIAEKGVEFYKNRPELGYLEPAYKKSPTGLYVVYNASTGKVLKNPNYVQADFKEILDYDAAKKYMKKEHL